MGKKNNHTFVSRRDLMQLPSRQEMIVWYEKQIDRLIDSKLELMRRLIDMQTLCAEKGWPQELARELEIIEANIVEKERRIERRKEELDEIKRGKVEGWPFRHEVYESV